VALGHTEQSERPETYERPRMLGVRAQQDSEVQIPAQKGAQRRVQALKSVWRCNDARPGTRAESHGPLSVVPTNSNCAVACEPSKLFQAPPVPSPKRASCCMKYVPACALPDSAATVYSRRNMLKEYMLQPCLGMFCDKVASDMYPPDTI